MNALCFILLKMQKEDFFRENTFLTIVYKGRMSKIRQIVYKIKLLELGLKIMSESDSSGIFRQTNFSYSFFSKWLKTCVLGN